MRVNRRYSWLQVFVAVLLVAGGTAASADEDPSLRAVWADAFHPGFKSTTEINSMVSRAVTGNYNAIIAEVLAYHDRGAGGHGAYWNSSIVPKAADIVGSIDPLAYLVDQAHAENIEVHAWIVPYRVSSSWPPSGNSLLAAHPEWLMVPLDDMGGGPAPVGSRYMLDPGSPDVQQYLIDIIRELVTDYAIDGINFDYIRYTQVDAGYPADEAYTKSSLQRFRDLTWYQGTPPPEGCPSWNDFRRRTIDELVRRSWVEIHSIPSNPQQPLRLTADLITWGNAPADFRNSDAYRLHQNWPYWMEQGWLDAGIPMNYKREHVSNEAQWYRNWVSAAIGWRYDRHIVCGQGNYLNTKANSITQLQYSLNAGANGTSNYSYYGTADNDLDGDWENDWTWYSYVASHLFTTPVPTPDMPWHDSAVATEGVLWGRAADPSTDEPIDGAFIEVGSFDTVETDGNGYYVVTGLPADSGGTAYELTARKADCVDVHLSGVVVYPGELTRQDIDLCDSAIIGDMDQDGDVDFEDLPQFIFCMQGPGYTYVEGNFCLRGDADGDGDLDLADLANFQQVFGTP
jgi:uncharacterized lipoprotein YddW (UPF0748 family)